MDGMNFDDARAFAARLAQAPQIVEDEMLKAVNRSMSQGIDMAQAKITENDSVVTGDMRRSTAVQQSATFSGGVASGAFGPSVPYAALVERGRGPVVAREGKTLRFIPKGSGQAVYRKRVRPAKAKPFMGPTADKLRPIVRNEFRGAVKRMVVRVSP